MTPPALAAGASGQRPFVDAWRRRKSAAFELAANSSAGRTLRLALWGRPVEVYGNANLSVYSAERCNARCAFCVEELRPASRGRTREARRRIEPDDGRWFARLDETLEALRPLAPSVSVTGGEPSRDRRLPRLLRLLAARGLRKRTLTTNGSGLLDRREGRRVLDWILDTGVRHLNVSRAHRDDGRNGALMGLRHGLGAPGLAEVARAALRGSTRLRLSCVLLREGVHDLPGIRDYLDFAARLGIDNVVFRQLMRSDPETTLAGPVTRYSDRQRVLLEPILDELSGTREFAFVRQVVGYYYYVEVWRRAGMDVVFEEADLAQLERSKRRAPGLVHELVYHPGAWLASTWQPWDGVLGPPAGPLLPWRRS